MDAKPTRFAYAAENRNNENLPPMANKAIHQRYKSTGSLLGTMSSTSGIPKLVTKTNIPNDLDARAKPAVSSNTYMPVMSNLPVPGAVAMGQENKNFPASKDAFLRPAQRPPKSVVPATSMNHLKPGANEPGHFSKQYTLKKRGPHLAVYSDNQVQKELSNSQQASLDKADRASATSNHSSQSQNDGQGLAPAVSEQQRLEGRLHSFHMEDPKKGNLGSNLPTIHQNEDDVTEAIYIDAVEELPNENFPVLEPEKDAGQGPKLDHLDNPNGWSSPALHENEVSQAILPHYEEGPVEVQAPCTSPVPIDNQADISDYEDEDYYDDQGYTTAHSGRDNMTGGITRVMIPPKLTKKGVAEIEAARELVESKFTSDTPDEEEWDISMVTEYSEDIFNYMKEIEMELLPKLHYMDIQTEITWSMRSVLMDWVIQVHIRFGLLPETLFLAVNFIDRFLSVKIVSLGKLQLVGATALLLAAKYEEINCPSVQEIVYMVDGGYTTEEILKAERFMLSMLNFSLGWPGPMSFLRRISKADDYDSEIRTVAKYFLEATIIDERFVSSPPSYLAAGAQCLSRMMLGKGEWTPEHVHYSGYTYDQIQPIVSVMLDCCRIARDHHKAIFEKFSARLFKRAAPFVEEQIAKGFELPFEAGNSNPYPLTPSDLVNEVHTGHQTLSMPIPVLV